MTITEPGVYSNVPLGEYVADRLCEQPTLSSGLAHTIITQSPLHALYGHPRLNPKWQPKESEKFDIGTAAHEALLQGLDRVTVIAADDWRTKAAREARDLARQLGTIPLLDKHHKPLVDMVTTAKDFIARSELAGVFDTGEAEQTIVWQDDELWMRARPDWLTADRMTCLHYKTCENANPDVFSRGALVSYGYDMSLAFYAQGLFMVDEESFTRQRLAAQIILAQEKSPPYSCALIAMDPAMTDLAARKVARAIKLWRLCMETDVWPAYSGRVHYAEARPWDIAAQDEIEYRGIVVDPVQEKEGLTA